MHSGIDLLIVNLQSKNRNSCAVPDQAIFRSKVGSGMASACGIKAALGFGNVQHAPV